MCGWPLVVNRLPPPPHPAESPLAYVQRVGAVELVRTGGYRAALNRGDLIGGWQARAPPLLLREGSDLAWGWHIAHPTDDL